MANKRLKKKRIKAPRNRARHIFTALGIGAFIAATSYFLFQSQTSKFADWYNGAISQVSRGNFTHADFPNKPGLEDITEQQLLSGLGAQFHNRFFVTGSKFTHQKIFSDVSISKETFNELESRAQQSISDFFEYCGIKSIPFSVSLSKVNPSSHIIPPTYSNLVINITGQNYVQNTANLEISPRNPSQFGSMRIPDHSVVENLQIDAYGEANRDYIFDIGSTNKLVIDRSPIIVTLLNGDIGAYGSFLAESMHHYLAKTTGRYIVSKVAKETQLEGSIKISRIREIQQEKIQREEAVVHALVDSYLLNRGTLFGFEDPTIAVTVTHAQPVYSLVPQIRRVIGAIGPEAVLNSYMHNPQVLFGK